MACTRENTKSRLTVEQLKNAAYHSEWTGSGIVQLHNGAYQEKITEDSAASVYLWLDEICAVGDIDFDTDEDAVVLLVANTGGSGTFYDLAAVINTNGRPEHVASKFLGDRVNVKTIMIEDCIISVTLTTHGPDDAMCCPTMEVNRTYVLDKDQLIHFEYDSSPYEKMN